VAFSGEQFLYTNPAASAIWLTGIAAPFALRELRDMRYVAIAYAALLTAAIALGAKGYYIIGIYAALFAFGAVAMERATPWVRTGFAVVIAAVALVALPISIPVLPLQAFLRYSVALRMTPADSPRPPTPGRAHRGDRAEAQQGRAPSPVGSVGDGDRRDVEAGDGDGRPEVGARGERRLLLEVHL